jgi:hypothetical protein
MRCEARGFAFDVGCDAELSGTVRALFAALERPNGSPEAVFSVAREAGPGTPWHVRLNGELLMGGEQIGEALHGLMVHVNQRVIAARDDLLSVHAAAVAISDRAAILPGASGSGKTTLCARLVQRGAAYLSDDSIAFDADRRLIGYPKALGFKAGTWQAFEDAGLDDLDLDHGRQLVWQIPPSRLGPVGDAPVDPAVIVVPRFVAGAALHLEPLSRAAAATALLEQAQNLLAFGVPGALEILGGLVARIPAFTAFYGDAREAAPAVLQAIVPAGGPAAPYQVFTSEPVDARASQPHPASDVSALCLEDGALLVRGESGEFAAVDRVGALVWPLLDGQRTVASIATELAPLFGATAEEVETDIGGWIDDLVDRGFLLRPPA